MITLQHFSQQKVCRQEKNRDLLWYFHLTLAKSHSCHFVLTCSLLLLKNSLWKKETHLNSTFLFCMEDIETQKNWSFCSSMLSYFSWLQVRNKDYTNNQQTFWHFNPCQLSSTWHLFYLPTIGQSCVSEVDNHKCCKMGPSSFLGIIFIVRIYGLHPCLDWITRRRMGFL